MAEKTDGLEYIGTIPEVMDCCHGTIEAWLQPDGTTLLKPDHEDDCEFMKRLQAAKLPHE